MSQAEVYLPCSFVSTSLIENAVLRDTREHNHSARNLDEHSLHELLVRAEKQRKPQQEDPSSLCGQR